MIQQSEIKPMATALEIDPLDVLDMKLNRHKGFYGNPCHGGRGLIRIEVLLELR